jgi:hypothetical protein
MRVAVGGRLKAGKSTLANALLGQRLAATDVLECTMLAAWFRYGHQNRIEVRCHDGRVYHVPGEAGGGIPRDLTKLGVPPRQIAELIVEVANQRLARLYTIMDTPGIDSLSGLDDVALGALARADALLYVTPLPGDIDLAALEELRRQAQAHGITAVNVLAVLSCIDLRGDGISDPWPTARRLAERYAGLLAGVAIDVVPVAGLLAETVSGDEFTDVETTLLRRLATADPGDLRTAIFSEDTFTAWADGPLARTERQRLLALLGRYGIMAAVRAIREANAAGTPLSTAALLAVLRSQSGIDELVRQLEQRIVGSADRLRASAVIPLLDRIGSGPQGTATDAAALAGMRAGLTQIRRHWLLRQARLVEALAELASGQLQLPPKAEHALKILAAGDCPARCLELPETAGPRAIRQAADQQVRLWQELEWWPAPAVRRWAQRARETCEALYFAASRPAP